MVYHGLRWYTTVYHGIPMYTMVYHDIPWYTMVYNGIQWYTMGYHSIPWYTMVHHGMPWYTMVHNGILWYTMVYHGIPDCILEYTMVYHSIPRYTSWYTMVYHGTPGMPWHTIVCWGDEPWYTMVYHGTLSVVWGGDITMRVPLPYHGIPCVADNMVWPRCDTMVYAWQSKPLVYCMVDTIRISMVYQGEGLDSWCTMVRYGHDIPWNQWFAMVYHDYLMIYEITAFACYTHRPRRFRI